MQEITNMLYRLGVINSSPCTTLVRAKTKKAIWRLKSARTQIQKANETLAWLERELCKK